jgi:hypothetical protein
MTVSVLTISKDNNEEANEETGVWSSVSSLSHWAVMMCFCEHCSLLVLLFTAASQAACHSRPPTSHSLSTRAHAHTHTHTHTHNCLCIEAGATRVGEEVIKRRCGGSTSLVFLLPTSEPHLVGWSFHRLAAPSVLPAPLPMLVAWCFGSQMHLSDMTSVSVQRAGEGIRMCSVIKSALPLSLCSFCLLYLRCG